MCHSNVPSPRIKACNWGPIPGLGVMGAAIAILATQALAARLGTIIFLRGQHGIRLSLHALAPDLPYIKRLFPRVPPSPCGGSSP
jgi:Na+-driven multidrug efflux pump